MDSVNEFNFLSMDNPFDRKELVLRKKYLDAKTTVERQEVRNDILKFVDKIVCKLALKFAKRSTISIEDYYQTAMTDIIDAIDNEFDFKSKNKISTFLFYKIYYSMQNLKATMDGSYKAGATTIKVAHKLKEYLENHPDTTFDELSQIFKIKKKRIASLLNIDKKSVSTSQVVDERHTIVDLLPDKAEDPLTSMLKEELVDEVSRKLDKREMYVFTSMFGFNEERSFKKLREVANVLGCTPERVRQIKKEVVNKIRQDQNIIDCLNAIVN